MLVSMTAVGFGVEGELHPCKKNDESMKIDKRYRVIRVLLGIKKALNKGNNAVGE